MSNPNFNYDAWNKWVATRPEKVQEVAKRFIPDRFYLLNGKECIIESIDENEDNTITFKVTTKDPFGISYGVFGVKPENLTPGDYII